MRFLILLLCAVVCTRVAEAQLDYFEDPHFSSNGHIEDYFDIPDGYDNDDESFENLIPHPVPGSRASYQCGCGFSISNPNPDGRIVNGHIVDPKNSRPYQAFVRPCFEDKCVLCGGTIINKRYIITAMHCIIEKDERPTFVEVGLGLHRSTGKRGFTKRVEVERIIERDDYQRSDDNDNDIAILRLAEEVEFNSAIVPACLPANASLTYANRDAVVSGWGTTSYGGFKSEELRETTVKITEQSDPTCRAYGELPMTQMCAYANGTDSCQGDSGGPLVIDEDGRFTLVGVVSYGYECAHPDYAGVYVRVTSYLDWIKANVEDGWCGSTIVALATGASVIKAPTTTVPTTTAPTTAAPATTASATNTMAPTTAALPRAAPSTTTPSKAAPTTYLPTTAASATTASATNTIAPIPAVPIEVDLTKKVPTTTAPIKEVPTTAAPTKEVPTTTAPIKEVPTTAAPTKKVQTTEARTTTDPARTAPVSADPTAAYPTTSATTKEASTTAARTTTDPARTAPAPAEPTATYPTTSAPPTKELNQL